MFKLTYDGIVLSKNKIKYIHSLRYAKYRQRFNKYIVEGDKIAQTLLDKYLESIEFIICTQDWLEDYNKLNLPLEKLLIASDKDIKQITAFKTPPKVLVIVDLPQSEVNISLINKQCSIYLDNVQDPGNVGTIIRIADWFGIDNVIRSKNSADFFSAKTSQSSMASMYGVNLFTADLNDLVLKGLETKIYSADMHGVSINELVPAKSFVLVMGSEGQGISQEVNKISSQKLTIPGSSEKDAESLNVAIATGIIASRLMQNS